MDLEIQTRSTELDPSWRDLIDRSVARMSERFPEVLRLHVTLRHAPHHRRGSEVVSLLANVEGATLRAEKEEEDAPAALRAAFAALDVELERHQTGRRHVIKRPGARPQGSIKRVFREGGYGFIRYEPGRDVYFHRAALHGLDLMTLEPGTPVEFEIEDGARGPQASRVYPAGDRSGT
jgi:CspA family cold shock protein